MGLPKSRNVTRASRHQSRLVTEWFPPNLRERARKRHRSYLEGTFDKRNQMMSTYKLKKQVSKPNCSRIRPLKSRARGSQFRDVPEHWRDSPMLLGLLGEARALLGVSDRTIRVEILGFLEAPAGPCCSCSGEREKV